MRDGLNFNWDGGGGGDKRRQCDWQDQYFNGSSNNVFWYRVHERANKCVRELVPFFDGDIRADVFLRRLHMRVRMFIREHMKIMMYGCLYFKIRTYGHARMYVCMRVYV